MTLCPSCTASYVAYWKAAAPTNAFYQAFYQSLWARWPWDTRMRSATQIFYCAWRKRVPFWQPTTTSTIILRNGKTCHIWIAIKETRKLTGCDRSRQPRIKEDIQHHALEVPGYGKNLVRISSIVSNHPLGNAEHTIRDLHDILKSYYKVARKRFVDDVCKQAADYHLVAGPDTPIKVFSPAFVIDLRPDQLESIAGEDLSTRRKRAELQQEINNLEMGRNVLIWRSAGLRSRGAIRSDATSISIFVCS